jgi:hypothetical protein
MNRTASTRTCTRTVGAASLWRFVAASVTAARTAVEIWGMAAAIAAPKRTKKAPANQGATPASAGRTLALTLWRTGGIQT